MNTITQTSTTSSIGFKVEADKNAPVHCLISIAISASPEKVWSVLTRIEKWPQWYSAIALAKCNGAVQPDTTFTWKISGASINSVFHTVNQHELLGWQGKSMGATAIHNWKIVAQGNETVVYMEESMDSFLVKLLKKMMNRNVLKAGESWLQALKAECEK
jgi:hypothetical protein